MVDKIKNMFVSRFATSPMLFRSPGRVNLIGEHTDYNQGFVLPAAINKELYFAMAPNQGQHHRIYAYDLQQSIEVPVSSFAKSGKNWANYILGVIDQLRQQGRTIGGFDCVFGGNIPQGAGLSSSAALECGIGTALNHLFDLNLSQEAIARMGQQAENHYVGVQCGIMDQFANVFGRRGQVIQLDCRSLQHQYFPLDIQDHKIVLLDTNVSHSLASSEYNTRRQQCEEGVRALQQQGLNIASLRDVTPEMVVQYQAVMDPVVFARCHYVAEENRRVEEACRFLAQGDLRAFGSKMYESHVGLSQQYEVSCPELDFLVEQTRGRNEVLGARMMGGGFGGCTINLMRSTAIEALTVQWKQAYQAAFNRELQVYTADIVDGTSVLP